MFAHSFCRKCVNIYVASQVGSQESPANAGYVGDVGVIPESGISSGGGHGNSL